MAAFPPPQPFPRHCSIPITKFHNYANCSNNNNNTRPSNSCFTSFCFRGEPKIEFAKPTTLASVPVRVSASYANWMLTCVSPTHTHTYRETLSHTHSHTRSHYSVQRDEEQLWCALSARTNTNNSWAAAYNSNNNNKQYNNRANNETCQRPDDDDDEEAR